MRENLERLKENLERVKEKLKSLEEPNFDQATQVRTLVGLLALASMLLPWIRIDGYSETMNGAEMIAYAFTDPGRASIFGISKLGTLAILLVPIIALAAGAYGFFRLAQGHHSLASHFFGSLMPLGMVLLSSSIMSSDGPAIAGFPIPGVGIFIMILAQGALFVDGMMEEEN